MSDQRVAETLAGLIRINSVNSSFAGGPGEREIGVFIKHFFESRQMEVWEQEVSPGRHNVLTRVPGLNRRRQVILEAHMDTVTVAGMGIPPFEPRIEHGKMYGRGACDTKGGLAAMMHAMAMLHETGSPPPCDVLFAAVVDEEYSFTGVTRLCRGLQGDAALVAEPTGLRAVVASKGILRWKIAVTGKAAHSAKPHLGANAIAHMAKVISLLGQDSASLPSRPHPLLGPATLNIGMISGGTQVNIVPEHCEIYLDRRLLPGEEADAVWLHYQSLLQALPPSDPALRVVMEPPLLCDLAMETPVSSAVARHAAATLSALGLNPEPCGVPYGSDASKLSRQGIPSIVFGPGSIDDAHGAIEFVELDQVVLAMRFYHSFIGTFGT